MLFRSKRIRMVILMGIDVGAICLASFLGLFIRFDMNIEKIPPDYSKAVLTYLPVYVVATLAVLFLFRMYATMWSVAGIREVGHIIGACSLASLIQIAGMIMLELHVPRSYFVLSFFILCIFEGMVRLSYRIFTTITISNYSKKNGKRVMIVGAGTSGAVILKEKIGRAHV